MLRGEGGGGGGGHIEGRYEKWHERSSLRSQKVKKGEGYIGLISSIVQPFRAGLLALG